MVKYKYTESKFVCMFSMGLNESLHLLIHIKQRMHV